MTREDQDDCVSRQAVIETLKESKDVDLGVLPAGNRSYADIWRCVAIAYDKGLEEARKRVACLPAAQPEKRTETHACDCISRQAAIDALVEQTVYKTRDEIKRVHEEVLSSDNRWIGGIDDAIDVIEDLPSAQPERTCVNCGRTANNGGWYADGRTRCPIEEHYALPKDGYCHLWEKRNVTDDDYPERREE